MYINMLSITIIHFNLFVGSIRQLTFSFVLFLKSESLQLC